MGTIKYWNGTAWIATVIGAQGVQGTRGYQGPQGLQGNQGITGIQAGSTAPLNTSTLWLNNTVTGVVNAGPQGAQGSQGPSSFTASATAPSNTSTIWLDTSTTSAALASSAAGKNALVNGYADLWQRGTSFSLSANSSAYTADRWQAYSTAAVSAYTVSQVASGLTSFNNAIRVQRNNASTQVAPIYLGQTLESVTSIPYAAQTVTLSFYARAGANFSGAGNLLTANFVSGTGADQNVFSGFTGASTVFSPTATLTTSWQRFNYTVNLPSTMTQLGITFSYSPTGTASANDYFDVTGMQLELGSVATGFSRAGGTLQGEYALCQRYFWNLNANPAVTGFTYSRLFLAYASGTTAQGYQQFPVQMRATPSVAFRSTTSYSYYNIAANYGVSAIAVDQNSAYGCAFQISLSSSAAQSGGAITNGSGATAAYVQFSAEL